MDEGDLELVLAWRNHRDIRPVMFDQARIEARTHAEWFDRTRRREDVQLLVFERDEEARGYLRLDLDEAHSRAEWGFYTAPDAQPGTGRALGEAGLTRVFGQLSLRRLSGRVLETNHRSLRFHERLGFAKEGVLREHHLVDGRALSVHCFGLLGHEWRDSHGSRARSRVD